MDIAWPREQMKLFRIDDQFSRYSQRSQSLIHLFAADDRNVEVGLTTHKQGWGVDAVGVKERVRHF